MTKILLFSVVLSLLSLILTYIIRLYASMHKIMDIPNERSSHTIPTPRGGGLAIVIVWYLGVSVLFYLDTLDSHLYYAFLCGIFLAVISIIDDLIDVKPFIRLSVQVLTAGLAIILLYPIRPVSLFGIEIGSVYLLYPFAIAGIVWFINLFNFLDGIDGYASLEAIIISFAMYLFTDNDVCLVLIASVLGFLYWNWPKAKIFMGDIGSTQLGFILIVLGIYFHNKSDFSIIQWIMLSSLFWFDATLTLYRRWRNKESLTIAHKKHAYQRAVQSGLSHQATILFAIVINCVIVGIVLLSTEYEKLLVPFFILDLLILYVITKLIDKRIPFKGV